MILSVETSTRYFSIFLKEGKKFAGIDILFDIAHSQGIVQSVNFLLSRIKANVNDIEELYAGIGPGSFTGIRVGLSFVNTLAQVLGIPVGGASTLDILAFDVNGWETPIVSIIRSRSGEVFAAFYNKRKRVGEYTVLNRNDFAEYINRHKPDYIVASEDDFNDITDGINLNLDKIRVEFRYPRASVIPSLVLDEEIGEGLKRGYLKPLYVRGF